MERAGKNFYEKEGTPLVMGNALTDYEGTGQWFAAIGDDGDDQLKRFETFEEMMKFLRDYSNKEIKYEMEGRAAGRYPYLPFVKKLKKGVSYEKMKKIMEDSFYGFYMNIGRLVE